MAASVVVLDPQRPHGATPPPPPVVVDETEERTTPWIRGVNLGGWLLMERFIVPYMFAVTDCHLRGDHCCFPGQQLIGAGHNKNGRGGRSRGSTDDDDDWTTNTTCELCDLYACSPVRTWQEASQSIDYPLDEYTLGHAFLAANRGKGGGAGVGEDVNDASLYRNTPGLAAAEAWLNLHFETFITYDDLQRLVDFGMTHVRVPLPHWILGGILPNEPWIVGQRWAAFARVCRWARHLGLQVWPDIHTAPGSQNGFDNSGESLRQVACKAWLDQKSHVERSLDVIRNVTMRIVADDLDDVVTGFGLLNEPFKDCDPTKYRAFVDAGLAIVREQMGDETAVYIGDMFQAEKFNDGNWGLDAEKYKNTYLDSHYYQVFSEHERALSPRQHIAYTCQKKRIDATSCCYKRTKRPWYNPWQATTPVPSRGVQRLFGEWSVAYDILPSSQLNIVMDGIAKHGMAPMFDRTITPSQMNFMKRYAEAQMVVYESVDDDGTTSSVGWFYWNIKMEGGAFAEWDFLRGIKEGWIPELPGPTQNSEQAYGTCYDIIFKTFNDADITSNVLPDPNHLPPGDWAGDDIDDDVVLTDGASLLKNDGIHHMQRYGPDEEPTVHVALRWILVCLGAALLVFVVRRRLHRVSSAKSTAGYSTIRNVE